MINKRAVMKFIMKYFVFYLAGVPTSRPRSLTVTKNDEIVLSTRPSNKTENVSNYLNFLKLPLKIFLRFLLIN